LLACGCCLRRGFLALGIDSEPFSAHTQGVMPLLLSAGFSSPIDVKVN